jgi:hypothetical protein
MFRPNSLRLMLGGVALVAAATGCSYKDCTLVGAVDGISVEGVHPGKVCLDDVCTTDVGPGVARLIVNRRAKTHTVVVDDLRYVGPIEFTKFQPNGPGCDPTVYRATFIIENGTLKPK